MRYLTHLGGARATIGLALVLIALGGTARTAGIAMLVANASSHLAVQILKRLVQRPRPCDATGRPLALVELPDEFSFPSGHTAAASSVALTLVLTVPVAALLAVPLAALVAVSRVTLRVHHATDVAAGALLGAGGALLAHLLIA
ncbi:MAG TPA: phosphatase PAP2 family protein [Gemmatimonadales bacterium]|nr:phosphatase PAP2 family protein [Gemmatimonadales bacterium]